MSHPYYNPGETNRQNVQISCRLTDCKQRIRMTIMHSGLDTLTHLNNNCNPVSHICRSNIRMRTHRTTRPYMHTTLVTPQLIQTIITARRLYTRNCHKNNDHGGAPHRFQFSSLPHTRFLRNKKIGSIIGSVVDLKSASRRSQLPASIHRTTKRIAHKFQPNGIREVARLLYRNMLPTTPRKMPEH